MLAQAGREPMPSVQGCDGSACWGLSVFDLKPCRGAGRWPGGEMGKQCGAKRRLDRAGQGLRSDSRVGSLDGLRKKCFACIKIIVASQRKMFHFVPVATATPGRAAPGDIQ